MNGAPQVGMYTQVQRGGHASLNEPDRMSRTHPLTMVPRHPLLWLIVSVLPSIYVAASGESAAETELLQDLFQGYRRDARPVHNASAAVQVYIHFSVLQLNELSTKEQYFSVNGWVTVRWQDFRLSWDVDHYGTNQLTVPPSYVWLPELTVLNTAAYFFQDDHYEHFKVQIYGEDGTVFWYPGGEFKSSCDIDVTYYPFDTQVCSLIFSSWVLTGQQVNFTWDCLHNDSLASFEEDGEWEVLDVATERREGYECCPEEYIPELVFKLLLRRRPGFYVMNIVYPSLIVSGLVLFLFWLPPEAGEKISMSLTLVLSYTIFILLVSDNVPNSSLAVPLIEIYLFLLLGLTGLSVCISIAVLYFHHHPSASPPPPWLRRFFSIKAKRVVQECDATGQRLSVPPTSSPENSELWRHLEAIRCELKVISEKYSADQNHNENVFDQWRQVAIVIDRICFFLFLFIFILVSLLFFVVLPRNVPMTFETVNQE